MTKNSYTFKELFPRGQSTDPPELPIDKFRQGLKQVGFSKQLKEDEEKQLIRVLLKSNSYGGKNEKFVDLKRVKEALDKRSGAGGKGQSLSATMIGKKIERMPEDVQHTLK